MGRGKAMTEAKQSVLIALSSEKLPVVAIASRLKHNRNAVQPFLEDQTD